MPFIDGCILSICSAFSSFGVFCLLYLGGFHYWDGPQPTSLPLCDRDDNDMVVMTNDGMLHKIEDAGFDSHSHQFISWDYLAKIQREWMSQHPALRSIAPDKETKIARVA